MPTPSQNAPDPTSPQVFSFSTCPDPDDGAAPTTLAPSPSSWHPHPPPPYTAEAVAQMSLDGGADDGDDASSTSPSPSPSPSPPTLQLPPVADGPSRAASEGESQETAESDEEMDVEGDAGSASPPMSGAASRRGTWGREGSSVDLAAAAAAATVARGDYGERVGWSRGRRRRSEEEFALKTSMGEYTSMRVIPQTPCAFLRPGSRFQGTQQSERQVYEVQVEIKHVDLRESFLCGYLKIQGLTEDHPTLTTYFEGEIIGTKYGFLTQHEGWGANDKIDLSHWSKFAAFRPYAKAARKGPVVIEDYAQKPNIFMRWKEHFLVPDHKVRTINGASFEGFYYICFNQIRGEINGIYFHSKSERFQQLDLKHVPDKGCFGAMEFR